MDPIHVIAHALNIKPIQVKNTLALLESNNTVPFIARYRKEQTQGLDEEKIFEIQKQYDYRVNLIKRKEDVIRLIDEQGLLSEDLKKQIEACERLSEVEEIYLPFKQKRLTKASIAISKGLEPLSQWMLSHDTSMTLEAKAGEFLNEEVTTIGDAIDGACDIIAENFSQEPSFKKQLMTYMKKYGKLKATKRKNADDPLQLYKMYYDYISPLDKVAHHHVLAINRAEKQKVLTVTFDFDLQEFLSMYRHPAFEHPQKKIKELIRNSFENGVKKMAYPSIVRTIRSDLTEKASDHSIDLFASNIESLLLTPPIKDKNVLAIDPAFRTGCKLAVVDPFGDLKTVDTIYPFEPQHRIEASKQTIKQLITNHKVDMIAIGNGTASRESEKLVAEVLAEEGSSIKYAIISEAGASVYSASPLAKKEFPSLDVSLRSAISIARRLQDPLAELIKIDPQSIGVGQYQHDLPPKALSEKVAFVVDKVVNRVGVNLNTASEQLLEHVSGMNKTAIKNILTTRQKSGPFIDRKQLLEIKGFGEKMFEQAAGFLRILEGPQMLDRTAIHPESYDVVFRLLKELKITDIEASESKAKLEKVDVITMSDQLKVDTYTLNDIIQDLLSPARDYREQFDQVQLRSDVLSIDDLRMGMILEGRISNIVDFGMFVDIGLKNDGFVHRSKCHIKRHVHPKEVYAIQQKVMVEIIDIDIPRNRISLQIVKDQNKLV